jgi:DNA-binding CsgD family transcriptional regulator
MRAPADGACALSVRQLEIIALIADGATGPEVAAALQISHHTVRAHIAHAMARTGARSRAQLVAIALNGHGSARAS